MITLHIHSWMFCLKKKPCLYDDHSLGRLCRYYASWLKPVLLAVLRISIYLVKRKEAMGWFLDCCYCSCDANTFDHCLCLFIHQIMYNAMLLSLFRQICDIVRRKGFMIKGQGRLHNRKHRRVSDASSLIGRSSSKKYLKSKKTRQPERKSSLSWLAERATSPLKRLSPKKVFPALKPHKMRRVDGKRCVKILEYTQQLLCHTCSCAWLEWWNV